VLTKDEILQRLYGKVNIPTVKKSINDGLQKAKEDFLKTYPYADLERFTFNVLISDTTFQVTKRKYMLKSREK
jgi:hypothetical protein